MYVIGFHEGPDSTHTFTVINWAVTKLDVSWLQTQEIVRCLNIFICLTQKVVKVCWICDLLNECLVEKLRQFYW